MLIPLLLLGAGAAAAITALVVVATADRTVPDHPPDITPPPPPDGKLSGHFYVNKILDKLRSAAASSGIPLGLLVGWVCKESGGLLEEWNWPAPHDKRAKPTTTAFADGERGYFQLSPDESKSVGADHHKLSQDPDYSIEYGIKRILQIARTVDKFGVAPKGSSYYWLLVKLVHTIGGGDVKKLVDAASAAGQAGTWDKLTSFWASGEAHTKHSAKKWLPFLTDLYKIGAPFGFGDAATMVGAAPRASDVESLARALESCRPTGTLGEKQAVAWAIRNRAERLNVPISYLLAPNGEYGPRGSGGRDYASTAISAREESTMVARAVLSLPADRDPTEGAVDFWVPSQQDRLALIGALDGRAFLDAASARRAFVEAGLEPSIVVGAVELLRARG